MALETLTIASRFCGPPRSGNGGYVCGRIAAHIAGTVAVRLKAPPPLETELQIESSESTVRLTLGSTVFAEAKAAELSLTPPAAPSFAQAQEAAKAYSGFTRHVFPRCFVCGPQRKAGDGLRIFPGPLGSSALVAAPWVPDPSLADDAGAVRREFIWAALDCTSAFALVPPEGKAVVLGELCASVTGSVRPDEACVAVGWHIAIDGRKRFGGSAIYSGGGRAVAVARATWIAVQASAFAA